MSLDAMIRPAQIADLPALLKIYNQVVKNSTAIYEECERDPQQHRVWFETKQRQSWPVVVVELSHEVVAYGTLGPFRPQAGFVTTAEHSLYISQDHRGKGLGTELLKALLELARDKKLHALIAAIDSSNEASLRLHRLHGFEQVGRLPEVARKFGRWLDLIFMELRL